MKIENLYISNGFSDSLWVVFYRKITVFCFSFYLKNYSIGKAPKLKIKQLLKQYYDTRELQS